MEKTINCEECNVEFTFEENPKYPRKYCLNCSAKKKKSYADMNVKYAEPHTEGYGAPVEKINTSVGKYESKPKNGKEYHLSTEAVRSNALACAIDMTKIWDRESSAGNILGLAKDFEEWINGHN